MDELLRQRIRGCAVGAAVGDALGMPLEFGPARPADRLVREMQRGRLPAGTFTDDTEMALALAESLLACHPLDPADLARRFAAWYGTHPPDVGNQTRLVLSRVASGEPWAKAVAAVQARNPGSAGNGSVMRCWPVALAYRNDYGGLVAASRLQSEVTHPHAECVAGSAFINSVIFFLLQGASPDFAVSESIARLKHELPPPLVETIEAAPRQHRSGPSNSGWVRHTVQSAVWGLLTTDSFEEAVIQVANLGDDADTAASVAGALAGAAYGLDAIPRPWRDTLTGESAWPPRRTWRAVDLMALADALSALAPDSEETD